MLNIAAFHVVSRLFSQRPTIGTLSNELTVTITTIFKRAGPASPKRMPNSTEPSRGRLY